MAVLCSRRAMHGPYAWEMKNIDRQIEERTKAQSRKALDDQSTPVVTMLGLFPPGLRRRPVAGPS